MCKKEGISMLAIPPVGVTSKQNNLIPAFGVRAPIGAAVSLVSYDKLYKSPDSINRLKTFCQYIVEPHCFERFGFNNVIRVCIAILKDSYKYFTEVETSAKAIATSERFGKTFKFIKNRMAKKWCNEQTVKIEKNLKKGFIFINHINVYSSQCRFNVDEVGKILDIINSKKPAAEIQEELSKYLKSMKEDINSRKQSVKPPKSNDASDDYYGT